MRYALMMVVVAGLAQVAMAQTGATTEKPAEKTQAKSEKAAFPNGSVFAGEAKLVGSGYAFTEGPTFVTDSSVQPLGGYYLFCDVMPGKVYRWNGDGNAPEVFMEKTEGALGMAVKADGTLVQCRKDTRNVVEVKMEGGKVASTTVIAEKFEGKKLNATNDCIVAKDGSVWFTDPPFFTPKDALELDFTGVYRVAADGTMQAMARGIQYANGLAFSPDEKTLYVNDYRGKKLMGYSVDEKGALSAEPTLVADLSKLAETAGVPTRGGADGLRVRGDGTILATGPGGLFAIAPDGTLKDFLPTGGPTNVAIGGAQRDSALITLGSKVMSVQLVPSK